MAAYRLPRKRTWFDPDRNRSFSDPPAKAVQSEPRDGEAVLLRDGVLAPRRSQLHRHSHVPRLCGEAGRRLRREVAVVERCLWLQEAVFSI